MNASHYTNLPYAVEVVPDLTTDGDQIFVARHPELAGCMAQGQTAAEAVASLADAREAYLSSLLEDGIEPPRPAAADIRSQPFVITWSIETSRVGAEGQANTPTVVGAPRYAAVA